MPQKGIADLRVFFVASAQQGGHPDKARTVFQPFFPQDRPADAGKRKEGRPAGIVPLQKADRLFRILLRADDDVLHRAAERRFHGHDVFPRHADQPGDRAVDTRELAVRGRPHHRLDALGEALQVSLQPFQRLDAVQLVLRFQPKPVAFLPRSLRAAAARIEAHFAALFGVRQRGDTLVRPPEHFGAVTGRAAQLLRLFLLCRKGPGNIGTAQADFRDG